MKDEGRTLSFPLTLDLMEKGIMEQVPLIGAFVAGLISFVSPCVLPLVPAYISFVSGLSMDQMQSAKGRAETLGRTTVHAVFFVLGFSLIFIALGASATILGQFLLPKVGILSKIAGVVIVLFGLHMAGVFRIGVLNYEKRFHITAKRVGVLGSFIVGLAFAFGWTPCIGPILAAILAYAGMQDTVSQGIALLSVYSLGLGVPFILTGMAVNAFWSVFHRIKPYFRTVEIVSGILLVVMGLLIFTDILQRLAYLFPGPE